MADKKYVRIMKEIDSNGNGYPFKLNEINETDRCNTKSKDPKEFGGFNFKYVVYSFCMIICSKKFLVSNTPRKNLICFRALFTV